MKAYKGFNKDLTCRDFQYEIGKEYVHNGDVELCCSGFHACTNPFDVLNYYDDIDGRYCEVGLYEAVRVWKRACKRFKHFKRNVTMQKP